MTEVFEEEYTVGSQKVGGVFLVDQFYAKSYHFRSVIRFLAFTLNEIGNYWREYLNNTEKYKEEK